MTKADEPAALNGQAKITQLLRQWSGGNAEAGDQAIPLVYDSLHRLAVRYFRRERAGHTLQATALLDEAFMTLIAQKETVWRDRAHFIGVMARLMRQVLIDHARRRDCAKRGGNMRRVALPELGVVAEKRAPHLIALDEALSRLGEFDPHKSALVELRFFGGFSLDECAQALGFSRTTAVREWRRARAWLYRELAAEVGL